MDLDVERFIFEIENHPAIWNMKCDAYSDRVQKVKQWEEVINEFVDQNASVEEKKKLDPHAVGQWEYLGSLIPQPENPKCKTPTKHNPDCRSPCPAMKRKLCTGPSFNFSCDDDMEELNVAALSRRKESAAPLTGDKDGAIFGFSYPLALVLRLRVLQIVCGISAMVMGSVAFIEERHKFNMGLGIPAGGISVLAAAVSIHTSRGWAVTSGTAAGAGVASVLWAAAACLLVALVVQCCRTILSPPGLEYGDSYDEESRPSPRDLVVIACVQIALACATLLSAAVCARIDCA